MKYLSIFLIVLGSSLWISCQRGSQTAPETSVRDTISTEIKWPELTPAASEDEQLARLRLYPGFKIEYYARDITNARALCLSETGTLYVSTWTEGSVYALQDTDRDGRADKKYTLASGLHMPNGVAYRNGDLYVAAVSRLLLFKDIENHLEHPPEPIVLYDKYPAVDHHGWKYIAWGPDDKLYVPVGAPCNICASEDPIFTSITRLDPHHPEPEIVQTGIRNTVGFTWHPRTGDLWFTDNGVDWMGDDLPSDELNRAVQDGGHYGFPYCHQGDTPDPDHGGGRDCADYIPPAQKLGAHVAPLGLESSWGHDLPAALSDAMLIAEHGSWNRPIPAGYRLSAVPLDESGSSLGHYPLVEGWLSGSEYWGRPVDLEWMPDGSLLVSDDFNHAIYRLYYDPT